MKRSKLLFPEDPEGSPSPWLWLGTWSMGGEGFGSHDERESLAVLQTAVDHGVRHFDTAGFYGHGRSERLLHKITRRRRRDFFISTKGGLIWEGRKVAHRAGPRALRQQLHESLERLGTDYVDLYQLHWPDPSVPLDESIQALRAFRQEGLVRYWGVGNLTESDIGTHLSGEKCIPHQVHFNPIHNNRGLLMAAKEMCINCVISPLEQGLLGSGQSSLGISGIGKRDVRRRNPYFPDREVMRWNVRLNELAGRHSLPKASLMLLWICSRLHVHAVVPGPRKPEQLAEILRFRVEVDEQSLLGDEGVQGILSGERVRNLFPDDLWQHLERGPAKQLWKSNHYS